MREVLSFILHWAEIALWAVSCLWQEVRGEEPDCPACWKCEMMRVLVLCFIAGTAVFVVKTLLF